ncbi:hypothetical protein [Ornithinibacillus halophilus]|uniref:Uncharacterized protein n=1 Tax=Ornithinibacillus halophilus TaxID=930117 RepID=A0A1M5GB59_9BACI|nr:hypothetical protein [Ornithinibacillus halophilus]SHG00995.1 hypothetical protein SAMN05216225_101236 [Ornithinibacillus halophilus]
MILNQKEFDEFLFESFKDGRSIRELRLTEDEANYLKWKIPKAKFKKLRECEKASTKNWYEVNTRP